MSMSVYIFHMYVRRPRLHLCSATLVRACVCGCVCARAFVLVTLSSCAHVRSPLCALELSAWLRVWSVCVRASACLRKPWLETRAPRPSPRSAAPWRYPSAATIAARPPPPQVGRSIWHWRPAGCNARSRRRRIRSNVHPKQQRVGRRPR